MSNQNCFNTTSNFITISWKVCAKKKKKKKKKANKLYFALTLWTLAKVKVTESGMKWYKWMVPICMAGKKAFSRKVCMQCQTSKMSAQLDWTQLITQMHMLPIWIKNGIKMSHQKLNKSQINLFLISWKWARNKQNRFCLLLTLWHWLNTISRLKW